MYYLGISAFYHDSAAVLLKDGKVIVGIEEERLTRIKHDNSFPYLAIEYCLAAANISVNDIECIAYYEKPLKKLERILETYVEHFPWSIKSFLVSLPEQLTKKITLEKIIRKDINFTGRIFYSNHHLSHAAAAYLASPFNSAAILTIDGVGESETTCLWQAKDNNLTSLKKINFPHSLGLWYSTYTAFLGFRVNDDEYKVMGMAAYGTPKYVSKIWQTIKINDDGSFALNLEYFNFEFSKQMWSRRFVELFGEARNPKSEIKQFHFDLAASLQKVLEEIYLKIINHLQTITGEENICLGGGVALNAKAIGLVTDSSDFKNLYIFGASGDSGAALGAALLAFHQDNKSAKRIPLTNLSWGKRYADEEIKSSLENYSSLVTYEKIDTNIQIEIVSGLLNSDKVVACFVGGSEFGPRALGSRSILALPKNTSMRKTLNNIKGRELFRPFGGVVLKTEAGNYFDLGKDNDLPFMNICKLVREKRRQEIPALVHEDGSCRIQTVTEENGFIYELLNNLKQKYEIPCLINTSFNIKGQPIVETPNEALEMFINSKIDILVFGEYLVYRKGT